MTHLRLVRTPPHRHPVVLTGDETMHLPADERRVAGVGPQTRQARLTNDQFWPLYWPTVCGQRGSAVVYDGSAMKAQWCPACHAAMVEGYVWGPCDVPADPRCPVCDGVVEKDGRRNQAVTTYCGPACRRTAARRRERSTKGMCRRTCPSCGNPFETVQPHKIYCDRVCQRTAEQKRARARKRAAA